MHMQTKGGIYSPHWVEKGQPGTEWNAQRDLKQMPVATALNKLQLDQRKIECFDKRLTSAILKCTVVMKKKNKLVFSFLHKVLCFFLVLFMNGFWHPGIKTLFSMSSLCYNQPPNKHTIIIFVHAQRVLVRNMGWEVGGVNFRKTNATAKCQRDDQTARLLLSLSCQLSIYQLVIKKRRAKLALL